MRVTIHRGAREVGGSTVEVESGCSRIVLDLGFPLDADASDEVSLPAIAGLATPDPSLLGIVISHAHPDHYGLLDQVLHDIPVYIGAASARILAEAAYFTPSGARVSPAANLVDKRTFEVGPFRITPYLADHSAFDAYSLLIEADGKRLLYSGDLRGHGRKARSFERLVREPPRDVDVFLMEGTRIAEPATADSGLGSESDVEDAALRTMKETHGLVLAMFSPQNIDRLVSIYKAARRADRALVLDLYAASIVAATGFETIPHVSWSGVRVYVPQAQRVRVKRSGQFHRVEAIKSARIYGEELAAHPERFVMLFRASMGRELERAGCLRGAGAIWSMWPGYLAEPSGAALSSWLQERGIPLAVHHSSGHATRADLARLAAAVGARHVVPIHTVVPDAYGDVAANVEIREDGESWEV
jgi:ribonuclease J